MNDKTVSSPLDGVQMLDDLSRFLGRYLFCSHHQRHLLALWTLHSWCSPASNLTPYLAILSPQPQAGKTLCLQLLTLLCPNPSLSSTLSAPSLTSRLRRSPHSTILLDDAHVTLGAASRPKNPVLRSLIANGAHLLHGKNLFCPKAFALTGQLPDDLDQHSIPIILQPLPRNDNDGRWFSSNGIQRFDLNRAILDAEALKQRLSAWSQQHLDHLVRLPAYSEDDFPQHLSGLNPRRMQLVEPLLHIADAVAGSWPNHIRQALDAIFSDADYFRLHPNRQLLQDIHFCFSLQGWPERLSTSFLIDWLHSLPNRPWQAEGPINAHRLARLLGAFEVMPRVQRMGSDKTARGYQLADFQDAWRRHLGVEMRRGSDGKFYQATVAIQPPLTQPAVTQEAPEARLQKSEIVNKDAACNGVACVAQPPSAVAFDACHSEQMTRFSAG